MTLTAVSGTSKTIELLDAGADDYLTKPFDLGELISRARALIRRGKGVGEPLLQFGNLKVHTGGENVSHGALEVELSPTNTGSSNTSCSVRV